MANTVEQSRFKILTRRRLKVVGLGEVGPGTDVTEQLEGFRRLASLVDMGDVMLVPVDTKDVEIETLLKRPPHDAEHDARLRAAGMGIGFNRGSDEKRRLGDEPAKRRRKKAEAAKEAGEPEEDLSPVTDPSQYNIDEVIEYAEEHPDDVEKIMELEQGGKNRPRLLKKLTDLSEPDEDAKE